MALTCNTYPAAISNSGAYNVTTSLVEDITPPYDIVNLRVRAEITVSAVIVATVEKPKNLNIFDFADILKSLVTGLSFARNTGVYVKYTSATDGSPLVAYTILFTEVYEDAAGATQTGDTNNAFGTTYRFVPAKGDGTAFTKLVLHDSTCLFANKTLRNNITKFYTAVPYELWLVFFTAEAGELELFYSKDSGAYDHAQHFTVTDCWGAIIINIDELMASVVTDLKIQIGIAGGAKISEIITIRVDTTENDARTVLEYDGLLGGKEYLSFEGMKNIEFATIREYYTAAKKNRKGISFTGINRQKLETRFNDINNADYLKSLLISDTVKKLEASYATPTEVTVLTDTVKISNSDMFTNQIDIEYEY